MPKFGWARLPPRTAAGYVNVVVETPRGSQNKYKYDEKTGLFRLNRILFAGAAFPFDFGFVAGTRGGDGDPLDAILLVDAATFPGCIVRARPIGVVLAQKDGRDNHRIVTVPVVAKTMAAYRDIADIPLGKLAEIEQFFRAVLNVDGLEHALNGFGGRAEAEQIILRSIGRAQKKRVPVKKKSAVAKKKGAVAKKKSAVAKKKNAVAKTQSAAPNNGTAIRELPAHKEPAAPRPKKKDHPAPSRR